MARFIPRQRNLLGIVLRMLALVAVFAFAVQVVQPARGWFFAVMVMLAGIWISVATMTRRSGYRCRKCGHVFQVPVLVNFVTLAHMAKEADGTYYSYKTLTCPRCKQRTKARLMQRSESRGGGQFLK